MRRLPHRALDLLLASMKFQHNQTSLPLAKHPYLNWLVLANVHWPASVFTPWTSRWFGY
jgi:hypothetical protein